MPAIYKDSNLYKILSNGERQFIERLERDLSEFPSEISILFLYLREHIPQFRKQYEESGLVVDQCRAICIEYCMVGLFLKIFSSKEIINELVQYKKSETYRKDLTMSLGGAL